MRSAMTAGIACLLLLNPTAKADNTITATPVGLLAMGDANTGPHLTWRGSLNLSSPLEGFGGFSGLMLSRDCTKLTAISDDGWWFGADLIYAAAANLDGATSATIAPLLDTKSQRGETKLQRDAEALTRLDDETVAIAFESIPRVESYDLARNGFAATARNIPIPPAIAKGPENGEIEALGFATDGPLKDQFIAIAESNFDQSGNTRAWVWPKNGAKGFTFSLERMDAYLVTDLAILPGGDLLILQRNFVPAFTGMAIARVAAADIKPGAVVKPQLLFEARQPAHIIDNMEAIAICEMNGETRVSVMSDDNYLRAFQSTLLIQFALTKP